LTELEGDLHVSFRTRAFANQANTSSLFPHPAGSSRLHVFAVDSGAGFTTKARRREQSPSFGVAAGLDKGLAGVGALAYNLCSRELIWRSEALDLAVFFHALT